MFDYRTIVTDDELTMRFEQSDDLTELTAYSNAEKVGWIKLSGATFESSSDEVFMQYKLWTTRPERKVGKPVEIVGQNMEALIEVYEELLIGAYILTQDCSVHSGQTPGFALAIDWLRTTDFYSAPASTQYHDSNPGGLLVHSLNVYNMMLKLHEVDKFNEVNIAEATVAALTHDWCKIGFYESYMRNVKNESTGQWEKVPSYKVNQKGLPLGHGVTSLYIAMRLMRLTNEQALAIRWHMGRFNVADIEINELQNANAHYPMVYLIQFADQLACTEY